jgi:hypothetical protein
MKCGTSTLQAQLARDPRIFMTDPKEPNFFSDDPIYARGVPWYEGLFADAPPNTLKGEASTHYAKLPKYPRTVDRLAELVPSPKIIYQIRNPVERAMSHFLHETSKGVFSCDFETALHRHAEIVDYGRYAMQITPYLERFGRENVHLMSLECLTSNTQVEIDRLSAFLDLSPSVAWDQSMAPQNVSAERIKKFPLHHILIQNPVADALRRALVPAALRRRIREARRMTDRPEMSKNSEAYLRDIYRDDRRQLAMLFPGHDALNQTYPFAAEKSA